MMLMLKKHGSKEGFLKEMDNINIDAFVFPAVD